MEIIILNLLKPEIYYRTISELFRVFNSIKVTSEYLKILPMSRLALLVENQLKIVVDKSIIINNKTIKYSLIKIPDLEGKFSL
ncbi:MAG: chemotaxis protein histidine kinase CheA [Sulfurimonas sp.]|jgi:chemotaxis protein histidine kinase CheA